MKKTTIILSILILSISAGYAQWTVKTVPDPKDGGLGYVSNPDNILTDEYVNYIDSTIAKIESFTTVQVAVVVLNSIGDEVPKNFATELFNHWGIGDAEQDNGLLILFVLDQRRIEFETGYGLEADLSDAVCYNIQQDEMLPFFKQEKYGTGLYAGIIKIAEILEVPVDNQIPDNEDITDNNEDIADNNENNYNNNYSSNDTESLLGTLIGFLFLAIFPTSLFLILLGVSFLYKDYYKRYQTLRLYRTWLMVIFMPIPSVFFIIITRKLTNKWREVPRVSAKTGKLMHKLSEEEEDKHLEAGQISEEFVKSVDYDVWVSEEEGDVLIQTYKRWFTGYNKCPKCKYKTYKKVYDRTIRAATYSSSGTGERKYSCSHCKHSKVTRYTIPQKTRSSSSSSGSSSSFGGSSSWGGGSSGGGGAGSSW